MNAETKAIYNAYAIAKDKRYPKIIIENDCKVIVDVILSFCSCPWSMSIIVEDIKLFLENYPYVSLVWISRLCNIATHENAH